MGDDSGGTPPDGALSENSLRSARTLLALRLAIAGGVYAMRAARSGVRSAVAPCETDAVFSVSCESGAQRAGRFDGMVLTMLER